MTTGVFAPPNVGGEIKRLWVFFSVDPGGEGIVSTILGDTAYPMMTASEKVLARFKESAAYVAKRTGKTIRLVEFTTRETLMEFEP